MTTIDLNKVKGICIEEARKSDCAKMGFGVVVVAEDKSGHAMIVHSTCNSKQTALYGFCEGYDCVRFRVPSRTQSLIGACAHAEEKAIWYMIHNRPAIPLHSISLFVAGVRPNGTPYERMGTEWTCLRCGIIMNFAGIKSVNFWDECELVSIKPEDAVRQAVGYALGEKVWRARAELVFEGEIHQLEEIEFPEIDTSKMLRFKQDDAD